MHATALPVLIVDLWILRINVSKKKKKKGKQILPWKLISLRSFAFRRTHLGSYLTGDRPG